VCFSLREAHRSRDIIYGILNMEIKLVSIACAAAVVSVLVILSNQSEAPVKVPLSNSQAQLAASESKDFRLSEEEALREIQQLQAAGHHITQPSDSADAIDMVLTDENSDAQKVLESYDDIVAALADLEHIAPSLINDIAEKIKASGELTNAFIEGLLASDPSAIKAGTDYILRALEKQDVMRFIGPALSSGSTDLKALAVDAMWLRDDIDVIADLADIGILLPGSDRPYVYGNAVDLIVRSESKSGLDDSMVSLLISRAESDLNSNIDTLRHSAIKLMAGLGENTVAVDAYVLNELNTGTRDQTQKAFRALEHWMDAGYAPSTYVQDSIFKSLLSRNASDIDDRFKSDMKYILSTFELNDYQRQQLQAYK
jgi:hypothetical protein